MEFYSKVIESVNDIIYLLDQQGAVVYASPKCSSLFETDSEKLRGRFFAEYIHPEDIVKFEQLLSRLPETIKGKSSMKCRLKQKDGTWNWYFLNITLFEEPEEEKLRYIISAHDIAYHKKAEKILRENEKRKIYCDFLERCMEAVALFNLETRKIVEANSSFLELFGYQRSDLKQLTLQELVPKEHQNNMLNYMLHAKAAGDFRSIHTKWYKRNGEQIAIELAVSTVNMNGSRLIQANIRQITDLKNNRFSALMQKFSAELLKKEEQENIVKTVLTQICQLCKAHGGICLLINEEKTFLETICSVGIGNELEGVVISIDKEMLRRINASGSELFAKDNTECEQRLLAKSGDKISSTVGLPVKSTSGEVIGFIVLTYLYRVNKNKMEDIEFLKNFMYFASLLIDNFRLNKIHQKELLEEKSVEKLMKQNEEQVKQTQKMEALGTLAGGIAHDFNNILTGLIGYTELSLEDAPRESMMYQCLMESLKLAERAKNLVAQILSFSRKTVNLYQRVNIEKVLSETVRMLRAMFPSTICIKENYRCHSEFLYADPTELQQLIMNLCINAEHAMREKGGTLTVSTDIIENETGKGKRFDSIKPGKYVEISISDSGCGMDRHTMERIFEPFFTTKGTYEGTGLGLSVVHGIVTRHKGIITVDSEVGKGSVFDIYLPL